MENTLTGIQQANETNRTEWSAGGNGGISGGESPDTTIETGLTGTAQQYTEKISDAVSQAKDYLGDKVSTVSDKIKGFATDDLSGMALKAKDFARKNPGQAILVSAAAGVLLGLIIRGRR